MTTASFLALLVILLSIGLVMQSIYSSRRDVRRMKMVVQLSDKLHETALHLQDTNRKLSQAEKDLARLKAEYGPSPAEIEAVIRSIRGA